MVKSVIVSAVRTPVGAFQGQLASVSAVQLGALAIREAVARAGIAPELVQSVIMGNVLGAGLGQNPARQATIASGLPNSVEAMTINKVCGSGLKAVMLADQAIRCGDQEIIVAGGMESMSGAPYLLPKARDGYRMGNQTVVDSMVNDGLWDAYSNQHMGALADIASARYGFTREQQDEFAKTSYTRAQEATRAGMFADEIVAVPVPQRKGEPVMVSEDEGVFKAQFDKMAGLKPAFSKDGQVTAANASKINDGAAAFVIMSDRKAAELGLTPLAVIGAHQGFSHDPTFFTTAPAGAIQGALDRAKLTAADIDLWEINEAFSFVTLFAIREFKLDAAKVNIYGGAVAIGHPIGASGGRILNTLIYGLRRNNLRRGLATLCIGGGEGVALILERP
ncbi:MAG: acetyl-CoA C-acyltransferase [Deltaproteobacteria bacterium HGW-Deltaproteobacteria-22]|jgi:acetyl-CoA C-acetyltransferase|nr:MAG: acetyl-CoA C-acyltransferase [Deltaproteobacteria bacterium HGW-Deltaproteobacteria-22]